MPLPAFFATGNLKEILVATGSTIPTQGWRSARLRFTHNIKKGVIVYEGAIHSRPPAVDVSVNTDGTIGTIALLANDPGLPVTGIQWRVEIIVRGSLVAEMLFDAPTAGQTVNLKDVVQVPSIAAQWITVGSKGDGVDSVTLDGTELVASVQGVEVGRADLGPAVTEAAETAVEGFTGTFTTQLAEKVSKGELVVSVRDFGAVDNGTTDDSTAINAALAYVGANGGGVVLLGWNHALTATLVVPEGTTLRGRGGNSGTRGTKLTSSANSGAVVQMAARSSRLEHVRVLATTARRNASTTTGHGVFIGAGDVASGYPSLSRIGLTDVEIRDQPTDGVHLIGSNEMGRLDLVTVTDCVRHGFVLDNGTISGYTNLQLSPFIVTLYRCRAIECGGQALIALPAAGTTPHGIYLNEFEALGCAWDSSKRYPIPSHSGSELFQVQIGGRGHVINRIDVEDQQYAQATTGGGKSRTVLGTPAKGVYNMANGVEVRTPFFSSLVQSWKQATGYHGLIMTWPTIFGGTYGVPQNPAIEVSAGSTGIELSYHTSITTGASKVIQNQSMNARIVADGVPLAGLSSTVVTGWADNLTPAAVTISGDILTTTSRRTQVAGQGAAADDLSTIRIASGNNGYAGMELWLFRGSQDITVKHGVGNIRNASSADILMASTANTVLHYVFDGTNWVQDAASGAAVAASTSADLLTTGEESIPRDAALSSASMSNQSLRLRYFTARKTESVTKVRTYTTGTAAGATPTLCRIGIYSVAGNGNLTLVASTANDVTLWAAANTAYETALSASWDKVAGQRYAVAALVATAATAPLLAGQSIIAASIGTQAPRLTGLVTGQSDLPASITAGAVGNSGSGVYVEMLP